MAIDTKLSEACDNKEFNPWKVETVENKWLTYVRHEALPKIPNLRSLTISDSRWIGIDIGHDPHPTSVVYLKHRKINSSYRREGCVNNHPFREFFTSFYQVKQCFEWSGISYAEQRERVQNLIDEEANEERNLYVAIDGTGVGGAVSDEFRYGLRGQQYVHCTHLESGDQVTKLRDLSINDLLVSTRSAFSMGRIRIPKNPKESAMEMKKLTYQLATRQVEQDPKGRLRTIDRAQSDSSILNYWGLSIALALPVGYSEKETARILSYGLA